MGEESAPGLEGRVTPEDLNVRPAVPGDYEAVAAFTRDTWGEDSDYIPLVFHDWMDEQGEGKMTFVAEIGETIAGIGQGVMLSDTEAWGQGMRVHPDYRDQGVGKRVANALFDWVREQGADVVRIMVFSWNAAGLGQARALGYEPATEFRWVHPEPTNASTPASVGSDVDGAWAYWRGCEAATLLHGLVLDMDESWALRKLTPEMLQRASEETAVLTVGGDGNGGPESVEAFAFRTRTYDRDNDDGVSETWAEYGVAAWEDLDACQTVMDAISADAGSIEADRTRVLVPETVRFVSDVTRFRVDVADDPDFVLELDLTNREL